MQLKLSLFRHICGFILLTFLPFTLPAQTAQAQTQPPAAAAAAVPGAALAASPAVVPPAEVPANPTISITASQRVIQPMGGKLPTSTNLAVFEGDCDSSKGVSLSPSYTLMVTGSGLSITQQKPDKCIITANITIDPNTPPGPHPVILLNGSGAPVAATELTVMDTSAGAIPPGLPPEVTSCGK